MCIGFATCTQLEGIIRFSRRDRFFCPACLKMGFASEHSHADRCAEAATVRRKYPDRVPVICERHASSESSLPPLDKRKYLVPRDLTVGQFLYVVRRRMTLEPSKAIFMHTEKGRMPASTLTMSALHTEGRASDGFLYLVVSGENAFG